MKITLALTLLLSAALGACSSSPPAPAWQRSAQDSAQRATQAYLKGQDRVAALEWQRAAQELQSTGRPELLARLALLRCAAEVASLQAQDCPAFAPWRVDAAPADLAYADYLAGTIAQENWQLLPPVQRQALQNPKQLTAIEDPLGRLLAAAMQMRMQGLDAQLLDLGVDTAAAQGWRRPLLAWLLLRLEQARASGDAALAARLERRLALVQGQEPRPN